MKAFSPRGLEKHNIGKSLNSVPLGVLFIRVPYYSGEGDLTRDPYYKKIPIQARSSQTLNPKGSGFKGLGV